MKGGPSKTDMRAVNYLFGEGKTVAEVCKQLGIAEEGLVKYAPIKKKPLKKKTSKRKVSNASVK